MKRSLKQLVFRLLCTTAGTNDGASILMYHSVGENAASFTVRPETFEEQMATLRASGSKVISLSSLVERIRAGKPIADCVAITFDDGYADNFTHAFPVLVRYGFPASIFLTTARIGRAFETRAGGTLPMLDEDQIRQMQKCGLIEFHPHGHEHMRLDHVPSDAARTEIRLSRAQVSRTTGKGESCIYAYASGAYMPETVELLRELGFMAAVTVRPGLVRTNSPLFELPRNHVDRDTSTCEFIARLGTAGEHYERLKLWR